MQRRTAAITCVAALLTLTACNDEAFLTEQPFDFIGPANFYRTGNDAVAAVNGVYASFINTSGDRYYGRNFVMLSELSTEVTTTYLSATNTRSLPDNYTHTPTHEYVETTWIGAYQAINRANAVIDRVPRIDMDPALRTRIVGEAQFLRALHYFNLVGLFGGVPLRTTETSSLENIQGPRATEAEVYAQVIADLEAAIAALPERSAYTGADQGRASKGAARALLGKVYLQRGNSSSAQSGDFQKAVDVLRAVVASGQYSLVADYNHLFDMAHEQNSEVIFDIQNIRMPGLGGRIASHMAPPGSGLAGSQNGSFLVELPFLNSYHASDRRKEGTWLMRYNARPSGTLVVWSLRGNPGTTNPYGREMPTPRKFLDPDSPGGGQDEANYIILRYADVLLMLAEAINEVNGPTAEVYGLVEQVRARAGLAGVPLPRGLAKQELKNRIFEERRWELALEGPHGWFDSRRNWDWARVRIEASMLQGQAANFRGSRWPKAYTPLTDKYKLWPIPQRAIDLNPELEQNPGWG